VCRKWSAAEDRLLAEAIKIHGERNWQAIANTLEGRTGQQCLYRWQKALRPTIRRGRWTLKEDEVHPSIQTTSQRVMDQFIVSLKASHQCCQTLWYQKLVQGSTVCSWTDGCSVS
jgi:hypothetical protein